MVAAMRREPSPLRRALIVLGPGLVTGASDDDPSGIGTYAQAGAAYGYRFLWTTVLMLPMMISVQYISAKIGLVSGRGLGGVLRQQYPRIVVYPAVGALVLANTLNAGADIGAIAAAINLLVPIPAIVFVIPVSLGILGLQVFGSYQLIARVFKWLALALLAYIGAALFSALPFSTSCAARSSRRSSSPRNTSAFWWPCSARRSRPISSSGRRARRSMSRSRWGGAGFGNARAPPKPSSSSHSGTRSPAWPSRRSWPTSSSCRRARRSSSRASTTLRRPPMLLRPCVRSRATCPLCCSPSASSERASWPSRC